MIIGASGESDMHIINTADFYYNNYQLKRVYYSGYIPISYDKRLPAIGSEVPVIRENRLYQSDWLMRFYGFKSHEIANPNHPNLELDIDPKLGWALRNLHLFPIDINKAPYEMILRVPGIGVNSAQKIVQSRKFGALRFEQLQKLGIAANRVKYFITCMGFKPLQSDKPANMIKHYILATSNSKYQKSFNQQMSLF